MTGQENDDLKQYPTPRAEQGIAMPLRSLLARSCRLNVCPARAVVASLLSRALSCQSPPCARSRRLAPRPARAVAALLFAQRKQSLPRSPPRSQSPLHSQSLLAPRARRVAPCRARAVAASLLFPRAQSQPCFCNQADHTLRHTVLYFPGLALSRVKPHEMLRHTSIASFAHVCVSPRDLSSFDMNPSALRLLECQNINFIFSMTPRHEK